MVSVDTIEQSLEPLFPGLIGIHLEEASAERVSATLGVRPELCTIANILHGGAAMALADTLGAIGAVLNLPPGKRTATTDSSTKCMAAAAANTTIAADCVPLHIGRTTMVWQTRVCLEHGKRCAVVSQTQLVLD